MLVDCVWLWWAGPRVEACGRTGRERRIGAPGPQQDTQCAAAAATLTNTALHVKVRDAAAAQLEIETELAERDRTAADAAEAHAQRTAALVASLRQSEEEAEASLAGELQRSAQAESALLTKIVGLEQAIAAADAVAEARSNVAREIAARGEESEKQVTELGAALELARQQHADAEKEVALMAREVAASERRARAASTAEQAAEQRAEGLQRSLSEAEAVRASNM